MRYALIFLAACGASTPPPPSNGEPVKPTVTTCATQYAQMADLPSCAGAEGTTCDFPEGTCACGSQSYCGGIPPSPEMEEELAKPVWQCKPVRTDGCPDVPPTGTCDTDSKMCSYGDCCVQQVTCTNGTWVAGEMSCPP